MVYDVLYKITVPTVMSPIFGLFQCALPNEQGREFRQGEVDLILDGRKLEAIAKKHKIVFCVTPEPYYTDFIKADLDSCSATNA